MFGLGKKRSKLGKWIDRRDISQEELSKKSGVSKVTLTKLCNNDLEKSQVMRGTALKIINALKRITHEDVRIEDFWA